MWCPICNQGQLQDKYCLICCTLCEFKLNRDDEVLLSYFNFSNSFMHPEMSLILLFRYIKLLCPIHGRLHNVYKVEMLHHDVELIMMVNYYCILAATMLVGDRWGGQL